MNLARTAMNRLRRGWLPGLVLAGLLAVARAEMTTNIAMADGSLSTVRLVALPNQLYPGGFLPVRVRIENRAAEARTWRLAFNHGAAMMSRGALQSNFAFTVPATTSAETAVFVPVASFPNGMTAGQLTGTITGPDVGNENFTLFAGTSLSLRGPPVRGVRVVASPELEAALRKLAATDREEQASRAAARPAVRGRPGPRVVPSSFLDSVTIADPAQWAADWRTWSQFSVVLLGAERWTALDPARRRALEEWVALGGRLILLPAQEGERRESLHGFGATITLARPIDKLEPGDLNRLLVTAIGPVSATAAWRAPELVTKGDTILDLRIGGRWLVAFLIGFALLIGPVNLFYFAPVGRRHRLFVTVPLISLVGSVALAVVVVASDGWGGRGYRQSLVILLPGENEAAVVQRQVARTGMILRQSFALPADTELGHRVDNGAGTQSLELERNGDRASGDWFSSRTVQFHELRRITPTRARVDLVEGGREGRAPVLQSSVGASLRAVRYRDESGRLWKTDKLPPGQRITLEFATGQQATDGAMTIALAPGCFYAEADAGELAPLPTLGSIRWTDQLIHYTGRVEAAAK